MGSTPPSTRTYSINNTELEKVCNSGQGQITGESPSGNNGYSFSYYSGARGCHWNSKKKICGASSCPKKAALENCNGNWTEGKCIKNKGDTCRANSYVSSVLSAYYGYYDSSIYKEKQSDTTCMNPISSSVGASNYEYVTCSKLTDYYRHTYDQIEGYSGVGKCEKFTSDEAKDCQYRCEHRSSTTSITTYEYTKAGRKACNKLYGCMYQGNSRNSCSYLAIWAFVVILVIVILVVIAIIAVIVFVILKLCGSKSKKVDPAADKAASAPVAKSAPQAVPDTAAAPATQAPPPEVGPYVVIKVGKQESKTKKVESAVWGESIVFTGMGPEDDDVVFELHDNGEVLLGSADVRIPDYVNTKKRAAISLKNGEAEVGVLEADVEIQVQEEPQVKITGVFFVDKFTKA